MQKLLVVALTFVSAISALVTAHTVADKDNHCGDAQCGHPHHRHHHDHHDHHHRHHEHGQCHGRKPACCGCDTTHSKSRVQVLNNLYFELLDQGDFIKSTNLLDPEVEIKMNYLNYEPFIPGKAAGLEKVDCSACCSQFIDAETLFVDFFGSQNITTYHIDTQLLHNGCIVNKYDVIAADFPSQNTTATHYNFQWCPTEGCNYKIASISGSNFLCPCNAELTATCGILIP